MTIGDNNDKQHVDDDNDAYARPWPGAGGDWAAAAVGSGDVELIRRFREAMACESQISSCVVCRERWLGLAVDSDGVCRRCVSGGGRFAAANLVHFGDAPPPGLDAPTPMEELAIARVQLFVEVYQTCGGRKKGRVCRVLRETALVHSVLPRLPGEFDVVVFCDERSRVGDDGTFRMRRHVVAAWLSFLAARHGRYAGVVVDAARLAQLPEDASVLPLVRNVARDAGLAKFKPSVRTSQ
jgi:hypothetical protein